MPHPSLVRFASLLLGLAGSSVFAADAESRLDRMASKLAGLDAFSVTIVMHYDLVQQSGQKIQLSERRQVRVRRPNELRIDSQLSDGDLVSLVFDGKSLTLSHPERNVYAQVEHDGDIDSVLRYAVGTLGIRTPLARLLTTDLPDDIRKLTQSLSYIERNTLDALPTHHLAGQGKDVDYQVWLTDEDMLARVVIAYKHEPAQPQFQADLSNWNTSPKLSDEDFAFTPPDGAEHIPLLLPRRSSAALTGDAK
jgi:hypothetical protein